MNNYKDPYIIRKIINYRFNFNDLNPRQFPQVRTDSPLYCPFHDNSRTGTMQARIYFSEELNLYYIHCYSEGRNFYAADYVNLIMCKQKQLFKNPREFLLSKLSKDEFMTLYKLFEKNRKVELESLFKKKCRYIDNTFATTGNVIDYIETLYTG